jgi:hypothetical protein
VQGVVRLDRREGRVDDLLGRHFVLVTRHAPHLSAPHVAFLERIDAHVIPMHQLEDLDGRLTAWFDEHGIEGVLIRPDAYVFGATEWPDEVPALIDDLHSHLTTTTPRITADVH